MKSMFANKQEWTMQHGNRKGSRRKWVLLLLILVMIALFFWLEWMGSEQSMNMIEQPVTVPNDAGIAN